MTSLCEERFWKLYGALPANVQRLADQKYGLWRENPKHPSLNFKPLVNQEEPVWEVRIGDHYRAFCLKEGDIYVWFWIGSHEEANRLY